MAIKNEINAKKERNTFMEDIAEVIEIQYKSNDNMPASYLGHFALKFKADKNFSEFVDSIRKLPKQYADAGNPFVQFTILFIHYKNMDTPQITELKNVIYDEFNHGYIRFPNESFIIFFAYLEILGTDDHFIRDFFSEGISKRPDTPFFYSAMYVYCTAVIEDLDCAVDSIKKGIKYDKTIGDNFVNLSDAYLLNTDIPNDVLRKKIDQMESIRTEERIELEATYFRNLASLYFRILDCNNFRKSLEMALKLNPEVDDGHNLKKLTCLE